MNMNEQLEVPTLELGCTVMKQEPSKNEVPALGHRFQSVHFNTDKNGKKPPSVFLQVPAFRPSLGTEITSEQQMAIYALLDGMQHKAIKEWIAASYDPSCLDEVQNFQQCCVDYMLDGRGEREGIKQSIVMEWIGGAFREYLSTRIERNLQQQSKEQRKQLVDHFVEVFKLAATRGNKGKGKNGEVVFCSLAKLRNLESRMEQYCTDPNPEWVLERNEVVDTVISRIAGHIAVLEAQLEDKELGTEQF